MSAQRLMEIAQRLDELAEDGPSELTAISEELGGIAAQWPEPTKREKPVWFDEVRHAIERAVRYEVGDRYGYRDPRLQYEYERMMSEQRIFHFAPVPVPDFLKSTSVKDPA